jgi:hypothetical protein
VNNVVPDKTGGRERAVNIPTFHGAKITLSDAWSFVVWPARAELLQKNGVTPSGMFFKKPATAPFTRSGATDTVF